MRILMVEDDANAAELLRRGLTGKAHIIDVAVDGIKRFAKSPTLPFDAIVLDIMLTGVGGLTLIRSLRSEGVRVPILMLTGCDSVSDVVLGLDAGADDYLTKPFSCEVLAARLAVIARRTEKQSTLQVADQIVNTETHRVSRGRRQLALTPRELVILEHLMRRAGRVVLRDDLMEAVWGVDPDIGRNALEVYIYQLRSKLEFAGDSRLIQTVRGFGYRITAGGEPM